MFTRHPVTFAALGAAAWLALPFAAERIGPPAALACLALVAIGAAGFILTGCAMLDRLASNHDKRESKP